MQYLSVLTPPLLMCAVVVIAIVAFLRHEMRRSHPGADQADDIPQRDQFGNQDLDNCADEHDATSSVDGSQ